MRWVKAIQPYAPQVQELLQLIKDFLGNSSTSREIISIVDKYLPKMMESFLPEYRDELSGIATATGTELGEIVLFNIFYEVFTVCTSIVANGGPSLGNLHARNLDFGLLMGWDQANNTWRITEALRSMVINVDYTRGGKTVFKAVHFAGYVGVLTAIKPQTFTLSMNERFNSDGGFIGIFEWVLGNHNASWMGFLTRQVMETASSYAEAKSMLANTALLAPAYYILGSNDTGQGCVITRSREKAVDVWEMASTGYPWILETNYDHWEEPLFIDDRRTPANKCMQQVEARGAMNISGIFDMLSSKPVLNKLTTYTALMNVNLGSLESYIRNCPDPCWPW